MGVVEIIGDRHNFILYGYSYNSYENLHHRTNYILIVVIKEHEGSWKNEEKVERKWKYHISKSS